MRRSGTVEHTRGLGPHDHVCWAYDDREEFRRHAREFVSDGLAQGQQVWYVAAGDADTLTSDLEAVAGMDEALHTGAARVVSLDATNSGTVIDPQEQAQSYVTATKDAVAAGFTGLRVATECTGLVSGTDQAAAFARYEHLVDHYMAALPFSAMCAYHHQQVGDDLVAQVACLHPASNTTPPGFRLFGSVEAAATLDGELDWSCAELFADALRLTDPEPEDGQLVVDATGVQFMDHNCLLGLAEHAAHRDATLVLRTAWPGVARLVTLLDLPHVQVDEAA